MQKQVVLKLKPSEVNDSNLINDLLVKSLGVKSTELTGYYITKQSIDARSRQQIWYNITLNVFVNEPFMQRAVNTLNFQSVQHATKKVIVVGAGPAGLFAALKLIANGIKPIIIERGKDVRARRRDLAAINKLGTVNEESNYCFGEGGAGTYSDGKLYTRSTKRGDVNSILNLFVQFGADEQILYQSHPHIGTNKLPQIITAMREQIIVAGGEVHFNHKVTNFIINNAELSGIEINNTDKWHADAYILATGHSARDIFELLHTNNILIEAKPFALGVRVEHPQSLIDELQYHMPERGSFLPPAAYSVVEQVNGKGVFSFCMCPGGIIAPAATAQNEIVVNGWSPSKRNNPYSNSGMVVTVDEKDAFAIVKQQKKYSSVLPSNPLLLMYFQQLVEQQCYAEGGGKNVAPAQRMVDFTNNKLSNTLPDCSYVPGLKSASLQQVLPAFVNDALKGGFKAFGKKLYDKHSSKSYYTNEAVLVATESRTSSPVRIPRNTTNFQHPQIKNLYPCGEGAGYAGGIISAAIDGENIAATIANNINKII